MTATSAIPNTGVEQAINQRLDAIDRALLDLLPRSERLTLVAQVDARARELITSGAAADANLAGSTACPSAANGVHLIAGGSSLSPLMTPTFVTSTGRRRSRLAISAGLVGIAALVLLFVTPLTYVVVGILGELIGEIGAIALLGIHVGAVTFGGLAAVALAIAALIILKRRQGALIGHGWALAGLCTGPLPMFAGAATGLFLGLQLLDLPMFSMQTIMSETCPAEASDSSPATYAAPAAYSPAPACLAPPVASIPTELLPQCRPADPLMLPSPSVQPPIQPTASEAPASEPETRPEPPGVPQCGS